MQNSLSCSDHLSPQFPMWLHLQGGSRAQDVINMRKSQKSKEKINSCHSCARMGHLANKCPERKKHHRPSHPQTNTLPCAQAQSSTPASQTSVDHNVTELVRKALVKALLQSSCRVHRLHRLFPFYMLTLEARIA